MSLSENRPQSEFSIGPSVEDTTTKGIRFASILTGIQSRPLSPENIDTYAEDALLGLVNLAASVVGEYLDQNEVIPDTEKELEDKAFEFYGLNNLGALLDHVVAKSDEIRHIGELVERAESMSLVIVPPQEYVAPVGNGNGSFEKKSIIPRTKTLLFILANDFNVNLDDPEQVSIRTGILSDNMMRGLSYYLINVPGLNRTVLCCDEEGNVTYVFDNSVLDTHGISPDDLVTLTKNDINDLLGSDSKMGKRVIYSPKFVSGMIGLMTDLQGNNSNPEPGGLYLYPKAPEGIHSVKSLAKHFGVYHGTIVTAITELGVALGEKDNYRFGKRGSILTIGFTLHQQEMIRQNLENKGIFAKTVPDGILSIAGIANKFGVSHAVVVKAIAKLSTNWGSEEKYRFGVNSKPGFDHDQQAQIGKYLESEGYFSTDIPEGTLPGYKIALEFGLSYRVIKNAIHKLGDSLGLAPKYKFGSRIVPGFTPNQKELIRQHLERKGNFAHVATEDILSANSLANKLGVDYKTVKKVINRLKNTLGPMEKYKFHGGGEATFGLSLSQKVMIEQDLRAKGLIS